MHDFFAFFDIQNFLLNVFQKLVVTPGKIKILIFWYENAFLLLSSWLIFNFVFSHF